MCYWLLEVTWTEENASDKVIRDKESKRKLLEDGELRTNSIFEKMISNTLMIFINLLIIWDIKQILYIFYESL